MSEPSNDLGISNIAEELVDVDVEVVVEAVDVVGVADVDVIGTDVEELGVVSGLLFKFILIDSLSLW
jgi:hypothetical protein